MSEETPIADSEAASMKSTDAIIETTKDELDEHGAKKESNDVNEDKGELNRQNEDTEELNKQKEDIQIPEEPTERDLNPDLARFMTGCQQGQLDIVKELIESRKITANDTFSDLVTGLHWACINNRLTIVKYLCSNDISKADTNFLGGDLKATPLHWACRNGLVYIVDYLLTHTDADPSLRDAQSYNALHLAVHSSNIMLVIYLLLACCSNDSKKKIYVDEADNAHRTSLHWAAYQGDLLSINALLRFGADVNKVDDSLFIPLHWAFMKGYKSVLKTLVDAGSDIFAKNDQGKNTFDVAKDMNCSDTWNKVLVEAGRNPKKQWTIKQYFLTKNHAKILTFFIPYVILPLCFQICSWQDGYAIPKLIASILLFYGSILFIQKLILPIYLREDKALFKSPFLAGVFSATAFWAIFVWLVYILPTLIFKRFFTNIILASSVAVFVWSFFKAMFINPGLVPTPSDNHVIFEQVNDLIKLGKFDTDNFCVNTFVRKPLRSKYSRTYKKLVARFDHYCPWVYNEVGVRNHKLFMLFVYCLSIAVIAFSSLSLKYFDYLEDQSGYESDDESLLCFILSEDLCVGTKLAHFHANLLMFCIFQLVWISFLALVQTFQICKGLTTWEFSSLDARFNKGFNHSTLPRDFDGSMPASAPAQGSDHHHRTSGLGTCGKLLGLDQFALTIKLTYQSIFNKNADTGTYSSLNNYEIPTDYGVVQNWKDFWFLGEPEWRNLLYLPIEGENNLNGQVVDYYKLYELPPKVKGDEAV